MKAFIPKKREQALTLIEVLVIIAVVIVLAVILLPAALSRAQARAIRISCVNNLVQTGLAFRIFAEDNNHKYPMSIAGTNGGSMEFDAGPNVFRHFQVMSNELSTPYIINCPSERFDGASRPATNFAYLRNSNISYFIGVDASPTNKSMILAGDRNITNEVSPNNGVIEMTANNPGSWTREMHKNVGNILMTDTSVRMVNSSEFRNLAAGTGLATNRLQMP